MVAIILIPFDSKCVNVTDLVKTVSSFGCCLLTLTGTAVARNIFIKD